jgi:thiamine biosynthesis lipoprotein
MTLVASFLVSAKCMRGLLALSLFVLAACEGGMGKAAQFSGPTMGTSYHVTIPALPVGLGHQQIQEEIEAQLELVNALMSTYREDSDISQFNRSATGQWHAVAAETLAVVQLAVGLSELSGGSFNPAVGPLVDLWGFGAAGPMLEPPSLREIKQVLQYTDLSLLKVREQPPALSRSGPLQLDLSAIAKGYGVDRVAEKLDSLGVESYLVEVGGELRVKGNKPGGESWRIGIEQPQLGYGVAHQAIAVHDAAVATSGDYRNYYERDGRRYSHTIDPVTGAPVDHGLASVTVVAETAAVADALATAINVMGPARGESFSREHSLAVYFIIKTDDGFVGRHTPAFERWLEEQ